MGQLFGIAVTCFTGQTKPIVAIELLKIWTLSAFMDVNHKKVSYWLHSSLLHFDSSPSLICMIEASIFVWSRLDLMSPYQLMHAWEQVPGSWIVSSSMMLRSRFATSHRIWECGSLNTSLTFMCFLIQENAVVTHSIIGWKSSIGKWSRVQASEKTGPE